MVLTKKGPTKRTVQLTLGGTDKKGQKKRKVKLTLDGTKKGES